MVLFHLMRIISLLYLHNLFLFLSLHLYLVCVIIIIIPARFRSAMQDYIFVIRKVYKRIRTPRERRACVNSGSGRLILAPTGNGLGTGLHATYAAGMTLRWGICGAGKISHDFVVGLTTRPATEHCVIAVSARAVESASEFASLHQVKKHYGSYEELAVDKEVRYTVA